MNNNIVKQVIEYTIDELIQLSQNLTPEKIPAYYQMKEPTLPGEAWRQIPKSLLYKDIQYIEKLEVSNFGRIRFNGKEIAFQKDYKHGTLTLQACNNELVHRLVAEAWLKYDGESKNLEVHHVNNNGYDNRPENLIWITPEVHKQITLSFMGHQNEIQQ